MDAQTRLEFSYNIMDNPACLNFPVDFQFNCMTIERFSQMDSIHYITSHCIALHRITSHYIALHRITSHHIASHHITSHHITSHHITSHHITSHHITSHHITSHHITSHYITLHYITLHYITLHYITLHYITLHYITLHYITLHHITSHYITLHHITSSLRSRSSSETHASTVEVRHTSASHAILSERSVPGLTCDLLFEATWLCLEPGLVASGLEASVSPDRFFGTHCPRTFELRNCHWSLSKLCWKHIYSAKYA